MRNGHRRNSYSGFTLIELLVVVAVLALLITILLPSLGAARARARLTKCGANLRQVGQATAVYFTQCNDSLPIGYWSGTTPAQIGETGVQDNSKATDWTLLLGSTMNNQIGATYQGSALITPATASIRAIFLCPDGTAPEKASALTHYSAHPRLLPDLGVRDPEPGSSGTLVPYKFSHISRPAQIALAFDGSLRNTVTGISGAWKAAVVAKGLDYGRGGFSPVTINEGYLVDSYLNGMPPYLQASNSISLKPPLSAAAADLNTDNDGNWKNIRFRHGKNNTANSLMVDGHVESFRMTDMSNSTLLRGNVYVNR